MKTTGKYIVIGDKLYEVFKGRSGLLVFRYGNKVLSYEKDRDGPLLDKEVIVKEHPEWLI